MSNLTYKILTDDFQTEFDNIVKHPMQSWAWGEFKKAMGAKPVRIGFFENEQMVSGIQIIFSKLPKTKYKIGYSARCILPDNFEIKVIKEVAKENNAIFIKLEPNIYESVEELEKAGIKFKEQNEHILKNGGLLGTPLFTHFDFHLDITPTTDELLASFHSKTRYNIRLANRKGVKIVDNSTDEGIENFIKLMRETTARQGFFNHNDEYFRKMFHTFPKENFRIFEAVYEDTVLTSWILFKFHNKLYYPYGASSNKHRNLMPNNLILWKALEYGKAENCTMFDLWGCLGPNPDENDPWFGFHKFKAGYNPTLVEYIGTYDFVCKPILYKLFNLANKIRWAVLKLKKH